MIEAVIPYLNCPILLKCF